jgi:hypothetical protein
MSQPLIKLAFEVVADNDASVISAIKSAPDVLCGHQDAILAFVFTDDPVLITSLRVVD